MTRLTERAVATAKPRKTKYEISCSVLTGFTLRVLPSGKKAYYVRYRDDLGKDLRVRLGTTTELTFAEATTLAAKKLSGAETTLDAPPLAQRRATHAEERGECPTFAEFAPRFLQEHANVRLKRHTQRKYRLILRRNVLPLFGPRRLDEIGVAEVTRFHASMAATPYEANASLVLLSSLYHRAIEWAVLDRAYTPPTRGVKKFPEKRRERFLSPEERATLDRFLDHALTIPPCKKGHLRWHSVATIRLLAMTGMRRDEILDLTWTMVDFDHRCLRLPDSKSGQKIVPVSGDVLDLLRECRRVWESCGHTPKPEHVVYTKMGGRICSTTVTDTWCRRVRDRIPELKGVRLHDLRHSAASDALMAGVPLAVVGKILGHRKPETTARYAHIADSVMSDAVEAMSRAIRHGTKTGKRLKTGS